MTRAVLAFAFALAGTLGILLGLVAGGRSQRTPAALASAGPPSFAEIAQRVNPSVVNVTVIEDQPPPSHPALETDGLPGVPRRGEGSGFVVDPDGYILTNHHVVASPDRIRVRLADKRELPATLVGSDPSTDLALLKVAARNLPALALGDSDQLRVGEWVCAIGNPYRFDHSVTVGVVSSKGRKIYDPSFDAYIQTDAAINPGNSGGPLVNAAGEAIGISSAVSLQGQGIGFAVPSNVARDVIRQLKAHGHVSRGYLGIQLQELDADLARMLGVPAGSGAMVLDVVEGNAGAAAGLRRYDVVTEVSGRPIGDGDQLVRVIAAEPPGSEVQLKVVRDRKPLTLTARLAERAPGTRPPMGAPARIAPQGGGDPLGLVVSELPAAVREELRLPDGRHGVAVTTVVGLSGMEQLAHGDLVLEVNRQPTPDLAAYRKAVAALRTGEVAWLFVQRPRPAGTFLARIEVEEPARPEDASIMKPKVLVIDDEEAIRSTMKMMFEYEGYDCVLAAGEAGFKIAERERPDLIFVDIKMPQMDGLEVLKELKAVDGSPPVVILSGHGTVRTAVEATKLGAFDFIEKPPETERILLVARNALEQRRLQRKVSGFRESQDARYRMVGVSPAIEKVRDAITRAAPTHATVLILGESGVGKELVARAIHRNSQRKDEEFVQVNCAAIPEELIESELFGHEKGSFTGAAEKQIGKFELAHKGTIFLDEIGDMSLRTQAKVLRVLQEGEVERIGSQKTIQVDVRVVAATNKSLEEAIEKGEFREDLYFRLSVIPIRVPALRERQEDIGALVEHFVQAFSADNNFRPKTFTPAVMDVLRRHPWRGNIRELRNTVERLLIMVEGQEIKPQHLEDVLMRVPEGSLSTPAEAPGSLKDFKETAERAFLVGKLRESRWNISATATAIGTPRSNLYKKLEQYGISQEKDG